MVLVVVVIVVPWVVQWCSVNGYEWGEGEVGEGVCQKLPSSLRR